MRPVFEGLTSTELLSKCTHGGTQNVTESLDNIIWSLCTRYIFVGWFASSATLQYNEGKARKLAVYANLGLFHSEYHKHYARIIDKKKIKGSHVAEGQKAKWHKSINRQLACQNLPVNTALEFVKILNNCFSFFGDTLV